MPQNKTTVVLLITLFDMVDKLNQPVAMINHYYIDY